LTAHASPSIAATSAYFKSIFVLDLVYYKSASDATTSPSKSFLLEMKIAASNLVPVAIGEAFFKGKSLLA